MNYKDDPGKYGEDMVLKYIPNIKKLSVKDDKAGTDMLLNGKKIQVKFDRRICTSNNLYFEIQEKSKPTDKWRPSPCNAHFYFFVTPLDINEPFNERCTIIKVTTKEFYKIRKEYTITKLPNLTSKGYLIPINAMQHRKRDFPHIKKEYIKKEVLQT